MEQTEIQKQAEKFVEAGFKLVTKTKVRRWWLGVIVLTPKKVLRGYISHKARIWHLSDYPF
jgi:methionine synthase II (cobalamin-independent)